jgi:hypothetical protein
MAAQNSKTTVKRKGKPRGKPFKKGTSGNPGGRPKVLAEFKAHVQEKCAHKALRSLMKEIRLMGQHHVKASEVVLAYAWGKPTQGVELTGKDGKPIETTHTFNLSRLKHEELDALERLLAAAADPGGDSGGEGQAA